MCHEARIEAQRGYPPTFAVDGVSSIVPFNFKLDTLFLCPVPYGRHRARQARRLAGDFYKRLPVQDRDQVQSIALSSYDSEIMSNIASRFFRNVSTVVIASKEGAFGQKPCTCVTCTAFGYNIGQLHAYKNTFEANISSVPNYWDSYGLSTTIRCFKKEVAMNGGNLPQITLRALRVKYTQQIGDFILLLRDCYDMDGISRRSGRHDSVKNYAEIPENDAEFE